jgi:hypothetical protein
MATERQAVTEPSENGVYFAMIRRSPHSMYLDINKWFLNLGISKVLSHAQSESDGNITISVFFRKD